MKGLDADLIDRPSVNTAPLVEADAEWLVEDYEPRVSLDSSRLPRSSRRMGSLPLT